MMRRLLVVVVLGLLALPVSGQTVNPAYVSFVPSVSHSQTLPDGSAYVSSYTAHFYKLSAPTVSVKNVALGKPAPGADGRITVKILTTLATLSKGEAYVCKVVATGAVGSALSAASNTFMMVSPQPATEVTIQ